MSLELLEEDGGVEIGKVTDFKEEKLHFLIS